MLKQKPKFASKQPPQGPAPASRWGQVWWVPFACHQGSSGTGILRLVGRRSAKGAPDGGLRGPWGVCGQVFLDLGPSLKLRSTMGQAEVEVGSLRQAHPLGTLPSGLRPGAQASPHPGTPRGKCWAGLTGHETFRPEGLPTPPDASRDNCGTGRLVDSLVPPGLQEGASPGPLDPVPPAAFSLLPQPPA